LVALTERSESNAMAKPPLARVARQIVACERCPRLRGYCARVAREKKRAHRDETYWGRPVPGFGDPLARLLIVGLAPAAHGANRTGRVFTGDSSGDFLMRALHAAGFANQPTSRRVDDGLELKDAFIAAAVRCAPPDNKPTPAEIARCLPFLAAEAAALPRLEIVVALGRIAFDACLRVFGGESGASRRLEDAAKEDVAQDFSPVRRKPAFGHCAVYRLGPGRPVLVASYHPSRQNTNTGRLTPAMFDAVFLAARAALRS
jgi:uracil-DNA glycosylase